MGCERKNTPFRNCGTDHGPGVCGWEMARLVEAHGSALCGPGEGEF